MYPTQEPTRRTIHQGGENSRVNLSTIGERGKRVQTARGDQLDGDNIERQPCAKTSMKARGEHVEGAYEPRAPTIVKNTLATDSEPKRTRTPVIVAFSTSALKYCTSCSCTSSYGRIGAVQVPTQTPENQLEVVRTPAYQSRWKPTPEYFAVDEGERPAAGTRQTSLLEAQSPSHLQHMPTHTINNIRMQAHLFRQHETHPQTSRSRWLGDQWSKSTP